MISNGLIQLNHALFDELHDRGGRYCFGHRSDPNDCVNRHLLVARYVPDAGCSVIDDPVRCRCNSDNSGNSPIRNTGCEHSINWRSDLGGPARQARKSANHGQQNSMVNHDSLTVQSLHLVVRHKVILLSRCRNRPSAVVISGNCIAIVLKSVTLPLGVLTDSLVTMSTEVAIIIVTQLLIAGMGEEFGWRGFALQRLQHIMPPIKATLVIALFYLLWHAPASAAWAPHLSSSIPSKSGN